MYKKRTYNKRRTYKKGSLKKYIKNVVQSEVETKKALINYTAEAIPTSGYNIELMTLGQGSASNQRIGDIVKLTSQHMRLVVKKNSSATNTIIRMLMVIPYDPSSTTFPLSNYSQAVDQDLYTVLYDTFITLTNDQPDKVIKIGKKYNRGKKSGINIHYDPSGLVNPPKKNNIQLHIISNEATNTPTFDGYIYSYYKDA